MKPGLDDDRQQEIFPHNIEAEQQLLGAILTNNDVYHRISPMGVDDAFFDPVHHRIFATCAERIEAGQLVSPVTLKSVFENDPGLKEIGGIGYLVRLQGASISSFAAADYATVILDLAAKRELVKSLREAGAMIADGGPSAAEIAVKLEGEAGEVASNSAPRKVMHSFLSASTTAVEATVAAYQGKEAASISTGIDELDRGIGGLFRADSTVLAGRPSMGKTTIGHAIGLNVAMAGHGVFFASLEMTAADLANRAFSNLLARKGLRIPYSNMRKGKLDESEMRALVTVAQEMKGLPFYTGERECRDTRRFRSAAMRAKQMMDDTSNPLRLIVVDYIQKLEDPRSRNSYENASRVSDLVKNLAMDLDVPVVALSQLNREVESRTPPVPLISDLRESGKLEEDADNVLLAYRPAYYLRKKMEKGNVTMEDKANYEAEKNNLDIIIAKQRNGATRTVTTKCFVQYNYIGDLEAPDAAGFAI
jgi:replicative DNA helicase